MTGNSDNIKPLEEYHSFTKKFLYSVFSVSMLAGIIFIILEVSSFDAPVFQAVLGLIFTAAIILFAVAGLFFSEIYLPKCPCCNKKTKKVKVVLMPEEETNQSSDDCRWRILHCDACDLSYKVRGISGG